MLFDTPQGLRYNPIVVLAAKRNAAKWRTAAFLTALAAALIPSISLAAVSVETRVEGGAAMVVINRRPVIALRTAHGGLEPSQRAGIAAKRISDLAAQGQPAYKVKASGAKQGATVFWGAQAIVFATRAEAKAQMTTPLALADSWASQIRRQLTLPPIRFVAREATVPMGENRRVLFEGYSPGPFKTTVEPEGIASTRADSSGVTISGLQAGPGMVTIVTPDGSDRIPISVAKYAGRVRTPTPSAEVTGSSVPASVVAEVAWRAARAACALEPGASASMAVQGAPKPMGSSLPRQTVDVLVKMDGMGYLKTAFAVNVQVSLTRSPPIPAQVLFYSNNPEQVQRPEPLYAAPLQPGVPARLLYHHQNGTGDKLRISLMLINTGDTPARVHICSALADPRLDTVLVGYRAGAQFLKDLAADVGFVMEVPPRSRTVLWTSVLGKMDTASGVLEMHQIGSEGKLLVRVLGEPASIVRTAQDVTEATTSDTMTAFSGHQYPEPVRRLTEHYSAGSRWLFIRVGKHAISDAQSKRVLDGNYGVLYDIDLTLNNPTDEAKDVKVMFDPTAGIAGVASIIDGQFYGKSHVTGTREVPLASFRLSPGESRQVRVNTMPLAGSNYPATIVVRS